MIVSDRRQNKRPLALSAEVLIEEIKKVSPDGGIIEINDGDLYGVMYADGFYLSLNFCPSNKNDLKKLAEKKYWYHTVIKIEWKRPGWWIVAMIDPRNWCPVMTYIQSLQLQAENN